MNNSDFFKSMEIDKVSYRVIDFTKFEKENGVDVSTLPFSARVILENLLRNSNTEYIDSTHIESFCNFYFRNDTNKTSLIPFFPSRVLMQDFTGVPAVVDLAAMRDAVKDKGFDPEKINPSIPVDLVIDHSVQVDYCKSDKAFSLNVEKEYQRNHERYSLLKWAAESFQNFRVVPPGSGICHQVNLEYLAKVVCTTKENLPSAFPDTIIGTDSHTTMINGLGILGWGVGGIEAEAVMLGEPYYMKLPEIIGVRLTGSPSKNVTATDIVLMITEKLREENVVEKIVEYTGEGVKQLSLTDRATIANMSPEYGATAGYFPIDNETVSYLKKTSRNKLSQQVESYYNNCNLFSDNEKNTFDKINFSKTIEIDLSSVTLAITGPSKPNQRIDLKDLKSRSLDNDSFKNEKVFIAALTSCTNTSNPSVMIRAGLVARNAVKKGLKVPGYVKTSLSPGSKVVMDYLENSNLLDSLKALGFNNTGFGCMTCIGNSGPLESEIIEEIKNNNLNAASVLSGNRNFEARIHQLIKSNYLMSPALVVIFAIAGKVDIDFETEPIGTGNDNQPVFFKDIWPDSDEVEKYVKEYIQPGLFKNSYSTIFNGGKSWDSLQFVRSSTFQWDKESLYIKKPSFFEYKSTTDSNQDSNGDMIINARALLVMGDTITTDHISPAGEIPVKYPAGKYLSDYNVKPHDFNTYGSRRGNHEIMMRGTFGNIRIDNKLVSKKGGYTKQFPENEEKFIFDAAMEYKKTSTPLIVIAGKEYGTGSSRDWAAKGTNLLGIKAVIASSFERIHRNNLIGMGVLPLSFKTGEDFDSLNLRGNELFTISGISGMEPGATIKVEAIDIQGNVNSFDTISRLDTKMELIYYKNGGILNFVLNRKISGQ